MGLRPLGDFQGKTLNEMAGMTTDNSGSGTSNPGVLFNLTCKQAIAIVQEAQKEDTQYNEKSVAVKARVAQTPKP